MPLSSNGLWDADSTTPPAAPERGREGRDGRRRQDAGHQGVHARREHAGDQRLLEERAGHAGVARDEERGTPPGRAPRAPRDRRPRPGRAGTLNSGVSGVALATPRTPSVPKSRPIATPRLQDAPHLAGRDPHDPRLPVGADTFSGPMRGHEAARRERS